MFILYTSGCYYMIYLFKVQIAPMVGYTILNTAKTIFAVKLTLSNPSDYLLKHNWKKKGRVDTKEALPLYCHVCESPVSVLSKHCARCNRCVAGFDHHCKWVNNCIGKENYTVYIAFISSTFATFVFISSLSMYYSVLAFVNIT